MTGVVRKKFTSEVQSRAGQLRRLSGSYSLYETLEGGLRLYVRYSRVHNGRRAFYGLRRQDLQRLQGHDSLIAFLWDGQTEPLLIPFSEYEEVFSSVEPASDGQYKAQIYLGDESTELYIARAGRFNVAGHFGWDALQGFLQRGASSQVPELSHSQVQTLLGAIGSAKGFDIWVPPQDYEALDWQLAPRFACAKHLFDALQQVQEAGGQVDVVWVPRGASELRALFEVEHSTPVYSGLLRFNDVKIAFPKLHPTFSVVAKESRRALFVRQINRPTFKASGLSEVCSFLDYASVFAWYRRIASSTRGDQT